MNAARDSQHFGEDITVAYVDKFFAQNAVFIKYRGKLWDTLVYKIKISNKSIIYLLHIYIIYAIYNYR